MRYIGLLDISEVGEFGISFPDCLGCVAMGKDENDVFANAIEALAEWLGDLSPAERPQPRGVVDLRQDPDVNEQIAEGSIFVVVPFISEQARPARANISIDAGLLETIDETAKMLGLTRSSFLAQAAREKINRSA
ncbi:type II toxin-antitoxin system HicB family antitoxin [Rhodoblastus sp.]|uniref:type II toxin-antitoxin system HicB family antitoxin n=1 Tax=Rhodoblastus sp. TaxID=1962975 RepID=UPI003F9B168F